MLRDLEILTSRARLGLCSRSLMCQRFSLRMERWLLAMFSLTGISLGIIGRCWALQSYLNCSKAEFNRTAADVVADDIFATIVEANLNLLADVQRESSSLSTTFQVAELLNKAAGLKADLIRSVFETNACQSLSQKVTCRGRNMRRSSEFWVIREWMESEPRHIARLGIGCRAI